MGCSCGHAAFKSSTASHRVGGERFELDFDECGGCARVASERLRRDATLVLSGIEARRAFQKITNGTEPPQAIQEAEDTQGFARGDTAMSWGDAGEATSDDTAKEDDRPDNATPHKKRQDSERPLTGDESDEAQMSLF